MLWKDLAYKRLSQADKKGKFDPRWFNSLLIVNVSNLFSFMSSKNKLACLSLEIRSSFNSWECCSKLLKIMLKNCSILCSKSALYSDQKLQNCSIFCSNFLQKCLWHLFTLFRYKTFHAAPRQSARRHSAQRHSA